MELGLQESTKAAVRSGLGGTIISKLGVVEELKRGILVEVPIEGMALKRDFYIVHRRTSPLTNLAHTFLDHVLEQADEAVEHIQKGFILPSL
jgi:DNA-binding transcriptional LysR family regulator